MTGKISRDVTVPFKPGIFIPGVDMTLPPGTQNIKMLASEFQFAGLNFPWAMPQTYGAIGDGVHDDTAAIQAAVATGNHVYLPKPAVSYYVKTAINCTTPGQIIQGDGKGATIIKVDASFNLAAPGVFVCPGGPWVPGPQFRDFQINFVQPDTAVAANLIAYPPAFYAQGVARATWIGIKINAAMTGIDLRANAAGCSILSCELCCFNWHIYLDGIADSTIMQSCRFENDLLTTNQSTIYHAQAVGIISGRCDDMHVVGCLFFCFLGLHVIASGGSGTTEGNITNCDFDTYCGIKWDVAANMEVSGCMFTLGVSTSFAVEMNGGNLSMSACWFLGEAALAGAMVLVNGAITMQISASRFDLSGDYGAVNVFGNTNILLTGCMFNWSVIPTANRTNPIVSVNANCLLSMSACRFATVVGITGHALDCVDDGKHNVCGNTFNNWTANMFGGPNHVFANNN